MMRRILQKSKRQRLSTPMYREPSTRNPFVVEYARTTAKLRNLSRLLKKDGNG
jgi:hypothetical protein